MNNQDDIAIVGVGCRFPGAQNLDEYWNILKNGENHVIEVPRDRWNVDAFYDSDPDAPGKTYVRKVGIVKDHDSFDNRLFDINDIEASKMDPQQRFILESTFMALEDGGFPRKQMNGSNTGVYIGLMNSDYTEILAADINQVDNYTLTGGAASIAAARVSYVFNLLGPALAVDTACSSALIAAHLATQALIFGDCDMAICGGVNCVMLPTIMIPLSKARMVSPTGASRAFSAEADGYARGEGAGVVILKRLSDARAKGDKIWAVIKTATNQDGRMASPITAPSGQQQHALLKETYARYGINPADIQYIEAHGTGTPVGDPIEANSLGLFFGQDGSQRFIGSVKTNIGHLESAAGIAGLIKVLLMMKHATIVPSLHFNSPNPKIEFDKFNLRVPTECHPWEALSNGTRMACVNSFGYGGSNAHVVVIQDPSANNQCVKKSQGHTVVAISGMSKPGLEGNISRTLRVLSENQMDSGILSYTSTCRRDHYPHRVAVSAKNGKELIEKLKSVTTGNVNRSGFHKVFVFGGMGTSWDGMCKGLLTDDHFLQAIRNLDQIILTFADISLEKKFRHQQNSNSPIIGPLMLFACQVGLFSVWKAWGIIPDAIVGQSVGEVAAAYASGRINLEDAVKVIFYRTELLSTVTGGQMLVVLNYPVSEVEEMCLQFDGRINIAVYYSPTACSVSGDEECVQAVRKVLEENNKDPDKSLSIISLNVTTAFHSQRMDSLTRPLVEKIKHITAYGEEIQMYSTVSGKVADKSDFVTPEYWAQNLRQPVLFYQAIEEAKPKDSRTVFVEIGPKPILRAHLNNIFDDTDVMLLPSMERDSDLPCLLNSLCQLYSMGLDPLWEHIVPQYEGQFYEEPKYIFQRKIALYEPHDSKNQRDGININDQDHPFVKRLSGETPTFGITVNERQTPFIFEHMVGGMTLIPGTIYAEVALAVGSMVMKMPPCALTVSVHYLQPFSIQRVQEDFLTCQVQSLTPSGFKFVVFKQSVTYAHGNVIKRRHNPPIVSSVLSKIRPRCDIVKNKTEIYARLATWGLKYGEGLSILNESVANSTESLAEIVTSDLIDSQLHRTHFHPSVLDAMTQAIATIYEEGESPSNTGKPVLPAGLGSVSIFQPLEKKMFSYGKVMQASRSKATYNMLLLSTTGVVIAEITDFVIKVVGENSNEVERLSYNLKWRPFTGLKQNKETVDKSILLIAENKTLTNTIISCASDVHVISRDIAIRAGFSEIKDILDEHASNVFGIIFNQDPVCTDQISSPGDIFAYLCQACNNLRELLLFLSENNSTLTVTVLTRSTQSLYYRSESNNSVNIFGSQFWGMVRCLLKEDIYPFIQLIDIADCSKATISTLMEHIWDASSPDKEIGIAAGQAYSSFIDFDRASNQTNLAVEQTWNGNDDVRVIKAPNRSFLDQDFYLQNVQRVPSRNGMTDVLLQEILLQENEFFPTTMSNEIWDNIMKEHVQLISLEVHGFVTGTGEPVVTCMPINVCNRVYVPSDCLIPRSAIPSYRIGLLTLLCLAWNIYQKISRRNNVIIVTDGNTTDLGQIISDILRLCGIKNPETVSTLHIPNVEISQPTSILLLGDLEPRVRKLLFASNQLQELLACKGCHGDATLLECYAQDRSFSVIRLIPEDMFNASQIKEVLPNVCRLLYTNEKQFSQLFKEVTDLHFANISRGSLALQDSNLEMLTTSECIFRPNASYLVVGGLGGLGWVIVCLIAEQGGGLVATVSRKPPSDDMLIKIDELKKHTEVEIVCLQADVSDRVSLSGALDHLADKFHRFPLKGIFHGAGILDDAFLARMSKETFDRVCMPKILGTYNLHHLTKSLNLDYFVMQSSIASIAGNAGQSNYGAGNSFMDTFAHYRRSKGLAGQSINWGPLEVGMAMNSEQIAQQLEKSGFIALNKHQIKNCLTHSLLINKTQVCFMDFNWIEKNRHLYFSSDIRPVMERGGRDVGVGDSELVLIDIQMMKQKTTNERQTVLYEYISQVICQVLSVDIDDITPTTVVSTYGIDSMLAMTMVNQIRKDLSVRVPIAKILDNSTVEMLVTFADYAIMNESTVISDGIEMDAVQDENDTEMSVLQEMVYQTHLKWRGKHDHLFAVVLHFLMPAPIQWIKEMIKTIYERHTSLRTVYRQQGISGKAAVIEEISRVEIETIEVDDLNDLTQILIEKSKIPFDLSTEFPFRTVCAQEKGNCYLGLIFHSISFDLKSLSLFFNELHNVFFASLNGDILPHVPEIDVAQVMREALDSNFNDLKQFWHSRINPQTDIPPITFAGVRAKADMVAGYPGQLSEIIPDDLLNEMNRLRSKFKVTQFQFLASVYHLLLHLVSGQNTVALKTSVDTRMFMPALNDVITRCVNGVPLIANARPRDSIESFVITNSKAIMECVNMGLYPFNWIMKHATEKTLLNIARHSVVSENMTDFLNMESPYTKMKTLGNLRINHETRLLIWSDNSKNVRIQLDYLPHILPPDKAKSVMDSFLTLLRYITKNSRCLIEDIPLDILETIKVAHFDQGLVNVMKKPATEYNVTIRKQAGNHLTNGTLKTNDANPLVKDVKILGDMNGTTHSSYPTYSPSGDKHGDTVLPNSQNTSSDQLNAQLKSVLSAPITRMKQVPYVETEECTVGLVKGSYVMKITRQGWEHRVYLMLDKPTLSLRWGPSEGNLTKQLPLKTIRKCSLNYIGGTHVLIHKTRKRRFYFKIEDVNLAKNWMLSMRRTLDYIY